MAIRRLLPDDALEFQSLRLRGLLECPEAFTSSHAEEVDTRWTSLPRGWLRTRTAVFGDFAGDRLVGLIGVCVAQLGVNARNDAAIVLYRSMGFETYGTERKFLMLDGVVHDQHLMSYHHFHDAAGRR